MPLRTTVKIIAQSDRTIARDRQAESVSTSDRPQHREEIDLTVAGMKMLFHYPVITQPKQCTHYESKHQLHSARPGDSRIYCPLLLHII